MNIIGIFFLFGSHQPPYDYQQHLFAEQKEEGWRWRKNFGEPFQKIHEDMAKYEVYLDDLLRIREESKSQEDRKNYLVKNIALGKVGIIYQYDNDEKENYVHDWVYFIDNQNFSDKICAFMSGMTSNMLNAKTFDIRNVFMTGSANVGLTFREYVPAFPEKKLIREQIQQRFDACHIIDSSEKIARLYELGNISVQDKDYDHSEQWLLGYLARNSVLDNLLSRLFYLIDEKKHDFDKCKILRFVLHIHTKNDACKRCSQTISSFLHYLEETTKSWFNQSKRNITTDFILPPLILVSSRREYQFRRYNAGHENEELSESANPIYHFQTVLSQPFPVCKNMLLLSACDLKGAKNVVHD